jgi:plasmid stabilization system protein ParE
MIVQLENEVISDIENIRDYIASDNPQAAEKTVRSIFACIEDLGQFYNAGAKLDNHTKRKSGYRFRVIEPYLIFYKTDFLRNAHVI